MATKNIKNDCPFCGSKDKTEGKSIFEGSIYMKNSLGDYKPHEMSHIICSTCGSILNSVVKKAPLCSCELCRSASNL
jgi:DNA-directed RNA polymerase subunit RPC12/RpoP